MDTNVLKRLSTRYAEFAVHNHCKIFKDRHVYPSIETRTNKQVFWFNNNRGVDVIEYEDMVTIMPIMFEPIDPPYIFDTGSDDITLMPFYRLKPMHPHPHKFTRFKEIDQYLCAVKMR